MAKRFKFLSVLLLLVAFLFTLSACDKDNPTDDNPTGDTPSDNSSSDNPNNKGDNADVAPKEDEDIEGVTQKGSYGTNEPDATTFMFSALRLDLEPIDYEYLNVGTYGTNNYFELGGDIRLRTKDGGKEIKCIELEKNTLGWIKFTTTKKSLISFNIASTSSTNTSKVVLVNTVNYGNVTLASDYSDVTICDDYSANVYGTSFCKVTAVVEAGTYMLRSPAVTDKTDVTYRKNLMLLNITVSDVYEEASSFLLSADTLKAGTYTTNIKLFDGIWGDIKMTASAAKSVIVDISNKSYEEYSFGSRVKTGGKMEGTGTSSTRAFIITLKENCDITMYMMSSNSETPRTVKIYNESQATIHTVNDVIGSSLQAYNFTLEKGTYYLTSVTGGLNIYGLLINIKK